VIWQQYDQGIAAESDLQRAQTQVDAAVGDIARYTQSVVQDQNALNLLAGSAVPEDLLPSDMASVSPIGDISPGLSSEVLFRRPDIMTAEHQLKAAYAFIGAARASFFPRISLTTTIGTASAELSGLFNSGSNVWSFVPQASMPIFDMRTHAAYRVSKATRDIALVKYEKTIQTAFRDVADALATRGTVDQQVVAQESIVDSAQKIYDISRQRYTQGIDGYLSVLDAQRSLYSAQQALTSLRLAKLASQVSLYAVFGGDGKF
jgi:multidrug efflux system outer membrane protein